MTHPINPINAYTVPSVSITTARSGACAKANGSCIREKQTWDLYWRLLQEISPLSRTSMDIAGP